MRLWSVLFFVRRRKEKKGKIVETADIKVFACPTNRQKQLDNDSGGSASVDYNEVREAVVISINEQQEMWETTLHI